MKTILRPIAVILIGAFLLQDIAWANPDFSLQVISPLFRPEQSGSFASPIEALTDYIRRCFQSNFSEFHYRILLDINGVKCDVDFSDPVQEGDTKIIPCRVGSHGKYRVIIHPDNDISVEPAADEPQDAQGHSLLPDFDIEPLPDDILGSLPNLIIGERIMAVRESESRGRMKKGKLCKITGINSSTYAYVERRATPPEPHQFYLICRALKVHPILILKGRFWENIKNSLELKEKIYLLRMCKGWTQEEFAINLERAGLRFDTERQDSKRTTVAQWERGVIPVPEHRTIICNVLGDPDIFINIKTEPVIAKGVIADKISEARNWIEKLKDIDRSNTAGIAFVERSVNAITLELDEMGAKKRSDALKKELRKKVAVVRRKNKVSRARARAIPLPVPDIPGPHEIEAEAARVKPAQSATLEPEVKLPERKEETIHTKSAEAEEWLGLLTEQEPDKKGDLVENEKTINGLIAEIRSAGGVPEANSLSARLQAILAQIKTNQEEFEKKAKRAEKEAFRKRREDANKHINALCEKYKRPIIKILRILEQNGEWYTIEVALERVTKQNKKFNPDELREIAYFKSKLALVKAEKPQLFPRQIITTLRSSAIAAVIGICTYIFADTGNVRNVLTWLGKAYLVLIVLGLIFFAFIFAIEAYRDARYCKHLFDTNRKDAPGDYTLSPFEKWITMLKNGEYEKASLQLNEARAVDNNKCFLYTERTARLLLDIAKQEMENRRFDNVEAILDMFDVYRYDFINGDKYVALGEISNGMRFKINKDRRAPAGGRLRPGFALVTTAAIVTLIGAAFAALPYLSQLAAISANTYAWTRLMVVVISISAGILTIRKIWNHLDKFRFVTDPSISYSPKISRKFTPEIRTQIICNVKKVYDFFSGELSFQEIVQLKRAMRNLKIVPLRSEAHFHSVTLFGAIFGTLSAFYTLITGISAPALAFIIICYLIAAYYYAESKYDLRLFHGKSLPYAPTADGEEDFLFDLNGYIFDYRYLSFLDRDPELSAYDLICFEKTKPEALYLVMDNPIKKAELLIEGSISQATEADKRDLLTKVQKLLKHAENWTELSKGCSDFIKILNTYGYEKKRSQVFVIAILLKELLGFETARHFVLNVAKTHNHEDALCHALAKAKGWKTPPEVPIMLTGKFLYSLLSIFGVIYLSWRAVVGGFYGYAIFAGILFGSAIARTAFVRRVQLRDIIEGVTEGDYKKIADFFVSNPRFLKHFTHYNKGIDRESKRSALIKLMEFVESDSENISDNTDLTDQLKSNIKIAIEKLDEQEAIGHSTSDSIRRRPGFALVSAIVIVTAIVGGFAALPWIALHLSVVLLLTKVFLTTASISAAGYLIVRPFGIISHIATAVNRAKSSAHDKGRIISIFSDLENEKLPERLREEHYKTLISIAGAERNTFEEAMYDFIFQDESQARSPIKHLSTAWNGKHKTDLQQKMPTLARIMGSDKIMRRFLFILSTFRKMYPEHLIRNSGLTTLAPIQYAKRVNLMFRLAELNLVPVSESFRRHIVYTEGADGYFAVELKIPGEDPGRDTIAETNYTVAKEYIRRYGDDSSTADPLFYAQYKGALPLYGKKYSFSEDPLSVACFIYHDGKRYGDAPYEYIKKCARKRGMTVAALQREIAITSFAVAIRLHMMGYVGNTGWGNDMHSGNLRLTTDGRIEFVSDFGAFEKSRDPSYIDRQLDMDSLSDIIPNGDIESLVPHILKMLTKNIADPEERERITEYAMNNLGNLIAARKTTVRTSITNVLQITHPDASSARSGNRFARTGSTSVPAIAVVAAVVTIFVALGLSPQIVAFLGDLYHYFTSIGSSGALPLADIAGMSPFDVSKLPPPTITPSTSPLFEIAAIIILTAVVITFGMLLKSSLFKRNRNRAGWVAASIVTTLGLGTSILFIYETVRDHRLTSEISDIRNANGIDAFKDLKHAISSKDTIDPSKVPGIIYKLKFNKYVSKAFWIAGSGNRKYNLYISPYHCIRGAGEILMKKDGDPGAAYFPARLIAYDPIEDLALLADEYGNDVNAPAGISIGLNSEEIKPKDRLTALRPEPTLKPEYSGTYEQTANDPFGEGQETVISRETVQPLNGTMWRQSEGIALKKGTYSGSDKQALGQINYHSRIRKGDFAASSLRSRPGDSGLPVFRVADTGGYELAGLIKGIAGREQIHKLTSPGGYTFFLPDNDTVSVRSGHVQAFLSKYLQGDQSIRKENETPQRRAIDTLIYEEQDQDLRHSAIQMLAKCNDKEAVRALEITAEDERRPDIKRSAVIALGGVGDIWSIEVLRRLLQDASLEIRTSAQDAIDRIYSRSSARPGSMTSPLSGRSRPGFALVSTIAVFGAISTAILAAFFWPEVYVTVGGILHYLLRIPKFALLPLALIIGAAIVGINHMTDIADSKIISPPDPQTLKGRLLALESLLEREIDKKDAWLKDLDRKPTAEEAGQIENYLKDYYLERAQTLWEIHKNERGVDNKIDRRHNPVMARIKKFIDEVTAKGIMPSVPLPTSAAAKEDEIDAKREQADLQADDSVKYPVSGVQYPEPSVKVSKDQSVKTTADRVTAPRADKKRPAHLPGFTEETLSVLEECQGNQTKAAEMLKITNVAVSLRFQRIREVAARLGDTGIIDRCEKIRQLRRPKNASAQPQASPVQRSIVKDGIENQISKYRGVKVSKPREAQPVGLPPLGYKTEDLSEEVMKDLAKPTLSEIHRIDIIRKARNMSFKIFSAEARELRQAYSSTLIRNIGMRPIRLLNFARALRVDPVLIIKGKPWEKIHQRLAPGEKIRILRIRKGWTQKDFAAALKKAGAVFNTNKVKNIAVTVLGWEKGAMPSSYVTCRKIEEVLGWGNLFESPSPAQAADAQPPAVTEIPAEIVGVLVEPERGQIEPPSEPTIKPGLRTASDIQAKAIIKPEIPATEPSPSLALADKIKSFRQQKGWSRADLVRALEKVGVVFPSKEMKNKTVTVIGWENGSIPRSAETRKKLEELLGDKDLIIQPETPPEPIKKALSGPTRMSPLLPIDIIILDCVFGTGGQPCLQDDEEIAAHLAREGIKEEGEMESPNAQRVGELREAAYEKIRAIDINKVRPHEAESRHVPKLQKNIKVLEIQKDINSAEDEIGDVVLEAMHQFAISDGSPESEGLNILKKDLRLYAFRRLCEVCGRSQDPRVRYRIKSAQMRMCRFIRDFKLSVNAASGARPAVGDGFIQSRSGKAPKILDWIRKKDRDKLKKMDQKKIDDAIAYIRKKVDEFKAQDLTDAPRGRIDYYEKLIAASEEAIQRLMRIRETGQAYVFKAIIRSSEDYALGFGDENELGLAEELAELDLPLFAELLFHEAICFKTNHQEAVYYQREIFNENHYYDENRRWVNGLKQILRTLINRKAAVKNNVDHHQEIADILKEKKGSVPYLIDEGPILPYGNGFSDKIHDQIKELSDSAEAIVLFGDFHAARLLSNPGRPEKIADKLKVAVDKKRGLIGMWNVTPEFNNMLKNFMKDEGVLFLNSVDLSVLLTLYESGYMSMGPALWRFINGKDAIITQDEFEAIFKRYNVRTEEKWRLHKLIPEKETGDEASPESKAYYKFNEEMMSEKSAIRHILTMLPKDCLKKYLKSYLMTKELNLDVALDVLQDLVVKSRSDSYSDETGLWDVLLDIYLDDNTSEENARIMEAIVTWYKYHYYKLHGIPVIFYDILREDDINKIYKIINIILRVKIDKEHRDRLIDLVDATKYGKEVLSSYLLSIVKLFGIEKERLGTGLRERDHPSNFAEAIGPQNRDLYFYIRELESERRRGGRAVADIDDRIRYYTTSLDNRAAAPGLRGHSYYTHLREITHRNASSRILKIVHALLHYFLEPDENYIKSVGEGPAYRDGMILSISKDFSGKGLEEYTQILTGMVDRLKEGHRLKGENTDELLANILDLPEESVVEVLKMSAGEKFDEFYVDRAEWLIRLYYAVSERYGDVGSTIIPKIKDAAHAQIYVDRYDEDAESGMLVEFMEDDYQKLLSIIDGDDHKAILQAIALCRLKIKQHLTSEKANAYEKEDLLELDYNLFLAGKEMMAQCLEDIRQAHSIEELRSYMPVLVSMARFTAASGLAGVDFEQFIEELDKGELKLSQVHDLVRAMRTEIHKMTRKLSQTMRTGMSHIWDNLDYYELTDDWQARIKTKKETDEFGNERGRHVTAEGRDEAESYMVDNLIQDSGVFFLDDAIAEFDEMLAKELSKTGDAYARPAADNSTVDIDDQFYRFGQPEIKPRKELLSLWSKKGLNLVKMTNDGLPVPPGVILSAKMLTRPDIFKSQAFREKTAQEIELIRKHSKYPDLKLLLYARSGSAFMLPGLLVTIPNLGMNDKEAAELAKTSGDTWFAYDTYAEFMRSFAINILGIPELYFQQAFNVYEKDKLTGEQMKEVCEKYKVIIKTYGRNQTIPDNMMDQVMMAIDAVYASWDSEDAVSYRARHKISQEWGTVVILQKGVFGNLNPTKDGRISGTGVAALRMLPDGREIVQGKFRFRAIGDQLMSRADTNYVLMSNSERVSADEQTLEDLQPAVYKEILNYAHTLKTIFGNNQLFEFTVELGKVWITQSNDDLIKDDYPEFIDSPDHEAIGRGHGVSGGALRGWVANSFESAEKLLERFNREKPKDVDGVILLLDRVNPELLNRIPKGAHVMARIISVHAETLAQKYGITAVYGVRNMKFNESKGVWYIGDTALRDGETISIDGHENQLVYHKGGCIYAGSVPIAQKESEKVEIERMTLRSLDRAAELRAQEQEAIALAAKQPVLTSFERETVREFMRYLKDEVTRDSIMRYMANYRAILDKVAVKCQNMDFTKFGDEFKSEFGKRLEEIGLEVNQFLALYDYYHPRSEANRHILEDIVASYNRKPEESKPLREITLFAPDLREIRLNERELHTLSLDNKYPENAGYLIIEKPKTRIKLVSFDYDGIIEELWRRGEENLVQLFAAIKSLGLKTAITTTNPYLQEWFKYLCERHPETRNYVDYFYCDNMWTPNVHRYTELENLKPEEIMHFGTPMSLSFSESGLAYLHDSGITTVAVHNSFPYMGPNPDEILDKKLSAIMPVFDNTDDILSLIRLWADASQGEGATPDGFVRQGEKSKHHFESRIDAIRQNNEVRQEDKEFINKTAIAILNGVLKHVKLPENKKQVIEAELIKFKEGKYKIFDSGIIVKGKDDFFFDWNNIAAGELFIAMELLDEIRLRAPPELKGKLIEEYLLHVLICPTIGHYISIKVQQAFYPNNYPHKEKLTAQSSSSPYKGELGRIIREVINSGYEAIAARETFMQIDEPEKKIGPEIKSAKPIEEERERQAHESAVRRESDEFMEYLAKQAGQEIGKDTPADRQKLEAMGRTLEYHGDFNLKGADGVEMAHFQKEGERLTVISKTHFDKLRLIVNKMRDPDRLYRMMQKLLNRLSKAALTGADTKKIAAWRHFAQQNATNTNKLKPIALTAIDYFDRTKRQHGTEPIALEEAEARYNDQGTAVSLARQSEATVDTDKIAKIRHFKGEIREFRKKWRIIKVSASIEKAVPVIDINKLLKKAVEFTVDPCAKFHRSNKSEILDIIRIGTMGGKDKHYIVIRTELQEGGRAFILKPLRTDPGEQEKLITVKLGRLDYIDVLGAIEPGDGNVSQGKGTSFTHEAEKDDAGDIYDLKPDNGPGFIASAIALLTLGIISLKNAIAAEGDAASEYAASVEGFRDMLSRYSEAFLTATSWGFKILILAGLIIGAVYLLIRYNWRGVINAGQKRENLKTRLVFVGTDRDDIAELSRHKGDVEHNIKMIRERLSQTDYEQKRRSPYEIDTSKQAMEKLLDEIGEIIDENLLYTGWFKYHIIPNTPVMRKSAIYELDKILSLLESVKAKDAFISVITGNNIDVWEKRFRRLYRIRYLKPQAKYYVDLFLNLRKARKDALRQIKQEVAGEDDLNKLIKEEAYTCASDIETEYKGLNEIVADLIKYMKTGSVKQSIINKKLAEISACFDIFAALLERWQSIDDIDEIIDQKEDIKLRDKLVIILGQTEQLLLNDTRTILQFIQNEQKFGQPIRDRSSYLNNKSFELARHVEWRLHELRNRLSDNNESDDGSGGGSDSAETGNGFPSLGAASADDPLFSKIPPGGEYEVIEPPAEPETSPDVALNAPLSQEPVSTFPGIHLFWPGFAQRTESDDELLSNKGAGLMKLAAASMKVPPGFIIDSNALSTSPFRTRVSKKDVETSINIIENQMEQLTGVKRTFGDNENPLFLSMRLGLPRVVHGALPTILNIGLNDKTVIGLAKFLGNEEEAWKMYYRFVYEYNLYILENRPTESERYLYYRKGQYKNMSIGVDVYKKAIAGLKGKNQDIPLGGGSVILSMPFPEEPLEQVHIALANITRRYPYPGLACIFQAMVFGNAADRSCSGVFSTKNPATGDNAVCDVISKITGPEVVQQEDFGNEPYDIEYLHKEFPGAYNDLTGNSTKLESIVSGIADIEFTVENGVTWYLQIRPAVLMPLAMIRYTIDGILNGSITEAYALGYLTDKSLYSEFLHGVTDTEATCKPGGDEANFSVVPHLQLYIKYLRSRVIDTENSEKPIGKGMPASYGVNSGVVENDALITRWDGKVLYTDTTFGSHGEYYKNISGMVIRGDSLISHAASQARLASLENETAFVPCVIQTKLSRQLVKGETITVDGCTGYVYPGKAALKDPDISPDSWRGKHLEIAKRLLDVLYKQEPRWQPEYLKNASSSDTAVKTATARESSTTTLKRDDTETDKPYLRDIRDPEKLVDNIIESLLSIAISGKTITAAFNRKIKGMENGKLQVLIKRRLAGLKDKKGFDKLLQNMVIIPEFDNLSDELKARNIDPDDASHNVIFAFLPSTEKLPEPGAAIHNVLIDESTEFDPLLYYYPLFEMVAITLVKYCEGYSKDKLLAVIEKIGLTLEDINIEGIDSNEAAFLIFKVVPKALRIQPGEKVERYVLILRFIKQAA